MILPPLTADFSLYKAGGHYRSSSPTGSTSGVVPSLTKRNIYVSETGCELAGAWGEFWRAWTSWFCTPRFFPDDPEGPWYQLWSNP